MRQCQKPEHRHRSHSDWFVPTVVQTVGVWKDMVSYPLSIQFLFPSAMQILILFRCHPSPLSLWTPQKTNSIPVIGMNSRGLMIISSFCQWSIQEWACDLILANVLWKKRYLLFWVNSHCYSSFCYKCFHTWLAIANTLQACR